MLVVIFVLVVYFIFIDDKNTKNKLIDIDFNASTGISDHERIGIDAGLEVNDDKIQSDIGLQIGDDDNRVFGDQNKL